MGRKYVRSDRKVHEVGLPKYFIPPRCNIISLDCLVFPCHSLLQFLAVVQRHIGQDDFGFGVVASSGHGLQGNQGCHGHGEANGIASKVEEVFKEMDVRGDGEVSWEDFSAVRRDGSSNVLGKYIAGYLSTLPS